MTRRAPVISWRPPPALALLGRALAIGLGSGPEHSFGRGHFLAADPRGGALVIGPDRLALSIASRAKDDASRRAARDMRRTFHGHSEGRDWELKSFPKEWESLGPARAIVYESDKVNGGGTGSVEHFIHEFSPGARAYVSGEYLIVLGEKIRVDASGVRN